MDRQVAVQLRNGFHLGRKHPLMEEQATWTKTFRAAFRKGRDFQLAREDKGDMKVYDKPG